MAARSDSNLGGKDVDDLLVTYFQEEIKTQFNEDYSDNKKVLAKLAQQANNTKVVIGGNNVFQDRVIVESFDNKNDLEFDFTRAKFDEICEPIYEKFMEHVQGVMEDSRLEKSEIDCITLVGGSCRIPGIQKSLIKYFDCVD